MFSFNNKYCRLYNMTILIEINYSVFITNIADFNGNKLHGLIEIAFIQNYSS